MKSTSEAQVSLKRFCRPNCVQLIRPISMSTIWFICKHQTYEHHTYPTRLMSPYISYCYLISIEKWIRMSDIGRIIILDRCLFKKMGQARPLLSFIFDLFQANIITIFTSISEKCPSRIQCWDSNPWPSEHESPPITTRPGLPRDKLRDKFWGRHSFLANDIYGYLITSQTQIKLISKRPSQCPI